MQETVYLRDPNAAVTAERLYRQMIDAAAESGEPKRISNSDPRHAAYLMQTFFRRAEEHVRIYTTRLARKVNSEAVYASPHLIDEAKTLLAKDGSQISIIVQDDLDVDEGMEPIEHPLIAALSPVQAGNLQVFKYLGERRFDDFAVMDESAYRAEIDGNKATAIANFGDPEFASVLAQLFDWMAGPERCHRIVPQDSPRQ